VVGCLIIAERKPLAEIRRLLEPYRRVMVLGCRGCVTVCMAGGAKETAVLSTWLRLDSIGAGKERQVLEDTVERQCEYELLRPIAVRLNEGSSVEAILSLGCGIGVQALADCFPDLPVLPGLNTSFLGMPERTGTWVERCHACGQCLLDQTGGICPIARCAKNLLNGPCGGSQAGFCEIGNGTACAWSQIHARLARLKQLDKLTDLALPKNWSLDRDGGPRRLTREDWEEET
jgi:ferredoxin